MFEIKTFNDEHTCSSLLIHPNHRQANSEVLGTIIHDIKGQGSLRVWRPNDIIRDLTDLLQITWHAREFSLGLMIGTPEESFSKLPVYFHNMKKHNPGTVAYIKTDSEDHFEYCFFSIGCTIRAFRECCRKVIIMDDAHLKGKYKRTILYAVAMDGNNQILPIGYGIFPKETMDSWTWFLEKLHERIGDMEGLTMVTDRAPAIAVSIQNVFPNAQHGLCACKTTEFEFYWRRLRNIRDDVATYLSQIPRETERIALPRGMII
uniref:MULE transposase domain-containing protein n=1 Tax=Lactuca sativa TaxID=4236 RepID=A0A9R1WEC4_LACSA|nr:hypothetical protein LSAT_V11C200063670 [Lactuca sativa]